MKTTEIMGKTGLYGIIADPIHHVKTPQVVNAVLEARGVDGVLVPFHVPADRLDDPLPLPASCLRPEMLVAEIIMDPAETALMATARELGATVHPGLPMLQSQAVLMAAHMGAF